MATFAAHQVGRVGCGDLTVVLLAEGERRDYVESDTLTWQRKLVAVVGAEFERAVLVAVLCD